MLKSISIFFILTFTITLSAQSVLDRKVSLSLENVSIEKAIIELSQSQQINISYKSSLLKTNKLVSLQAVYQPIKDILKDIFKHTDIGFKEVSGQIVLFKLPPKPKRKYTIRGYITEKETGEFIDGAHIFVNNTKVGTFSNQYGFYSITLEEGTKNILVTYVGYQHVIQNIDLDQNLRLNIDLESTFSLPPITVLSKDTIQLINHYKIGTHDFNIKNIQMQPSIGGEDDIFRSTVQLPGIQTSADGIGGLHVRGGSVDQNLVLLDGVPIYNSTHALGLFSIYNTDAIKSAKMLKGSFPARYGGRLSSVMDIRMKEGNKSKFSSAISQSLVASKVNVEGPINKGKGSFFFSGRRAITELYIPKVSEFLNEKLGKIGSTSYHFFDINGKVNYSLTKKDKVFLSFYNGKDNFERNSEIKGKTDGINIFQEKDTIQYKVLRDYHVDWGNTMTAMRWNHEIMDNLFLNTTFTFSKYNFLSQDNSRFIGKYNKESEFFYRTAKTNFKEELKTRMIKFDFDYTPNTKHYIRFGGNFAFHSFDPGIIRNVIEGTVDTQDIRIETPLIKQREINGYFEDEIQLAYQITMNVGLRILGWEIDEKFEPYLQPRLSFSKKFINNWLWNVSYSKMVQPLHLLSKPSTIAFPAEVWLPSTKDVEPQNAWQVSTGVNHILKNTMMIGLELYYKKMNNIVNFLPTDSVLVLNANNWEEKIDIGIGTNYGVELSIQKEYGKLQGAANYTFSFANRVFPNINQAKEYPFQYDRRHQVSMLANYVVNKHLSLNSAFTIATSTALTLPVRQYQIPGEGTVHLGNEVKNSFRFTPYQRLDIGITYEKKLKYFYQTWQAGIYNVYNRYNVLYIEIRPEQNPRVVTTSGSPILPYLKYTVRF